MILQPVGWRPLPNGTPGPRPPNAHRVGITVIVEQDVGDIVFYTGKILQSCTDHGGGSTGRKPMSDSVSESDLGSVLDPSIGFGPNSTERKTLPDVSVGLDRLKIPVPVQEGNLPC